MTEEVRDRERQRLGLTDSQVTFLDLTDPTAFRNIVFMWNHGKILSSAAKTLLEYAKRYYKAQKEETY